MKQCNRARAEQLAENDPYNDYFRHKFHKESEYKDITRKVAERFAENNTCFYFGYELHEDPELKDITRKAAERLVENDPSYYFTYKLNENLEYKDLERKAAECLAEKYPGYYFYHNIHENQEYRDITKPAEWLAKKDLKKFFELGLHKVPEFKKICITALKNL